MEPEPLGLVTGRAVAVAQPARPDPAGGAELRDLLEQVDVRVEEERQPRGEDVDVQPPRQTELDVGEAVGEGERQLLRGRGTGLTDVVPGHRDRLEAGHLGGAVLEQVPDQSQVRLG